MLWTQSHVVEVEMQQYTNKRPPPGTGGQNLTLTARGSTLNVRILTLDVSI